MEEMFLTDFRGWDYCDWEKDFSKDKSGHDALVRRLKEVIKTKYHLGISKLENDECISWRRRGKPVFAYNPDLIINVGDALEDRIFIEYVNNTGKYLQNFLRCLRGMLVLSASVKRYQGFVLAVRGSIYQDCYIPFHKRNCGLVEPMELKSLFFALDKKDYDYLVGKTSSGHK